MNVGMNAGIVTGQQQALGSVKCELVRSKIWAIESLAEQNNVVGVKARIGTKMLCMTIA